MSTFPEGFRLTPGSRWFSSISIQYENHLAKEKFDVSRSAAMIFQLANWKQRSMTAQFVQSGGGRVHGDLWVKEKSASHVLYSLF